MPVQTRPDKLDALVASAQFDVCGNGCCGPSRPRPAAERYVYRASLPNGGTVNLFKVLLTNACVNDCAYCVNRRGADTPRSAYTAEEMAGLFMDFYSRRLVQGLFLSSGIGGDANRTMSALVDTVAILRQRYHYRDYIHLKIMPEADYGCVFEACRLADRVSVNMEAPTQAYLSRLSHRKDLARGIIERMHWVKGLKDGDARLAPSGQTTQFVVGGAGESDGDILGVVQDLYKDMGLQRAYFSAYHPVGDPRLEGVPATPPMREHRLYQADWLARVYGFSPAEIKLAIGKSGNLSLARDPKHIIALASPWLFPVDVNRAGYEALIHVPGLGPVVAKRIVAARADRRIDSLQQLYKMRLLHQAVPFIYFDGMPRSERQAPLPLPELEEAEANTAESLHHVHDAVDGNLAARR